MRKKLKMNRSMNDGSSGLSLYHPVAKLLAAARLGMHTIGKRAVTVLISVSLSILAPMALAGPHAFSHIRLRNLGPAASGGRVTSVVGIPGNPLVYYVGAAGGGVWKTVNGGDSWTELLKHADSASVGAVALAPSNPNDVWVGTGEADPRNDITTGHGVYFSPDGGKTWEFKGLEKAGQISAIVVNPDNPDVVYVAVLGNVWHPGKTRGVYMTTNGGKSWSRVLYVNDVTGASALVMDPHNPNVLFAGMWTVQRRPWTLLNGSKAGGIWRSVDGGRKWTKLHDGLPRSLPTNRVGLAIAPSNPKVVYALMANKHGLLYRSEDMGTDWTMVSDDYNIDVRPFYFSVLAVSPSDPDKVYFGGFRLRESINGGKTSKIADQGVHPDHHAIWIDPKDPERIIQGNDGGVYVTLDGGKVWRHLDNLPIEQFYSVSIDPTVPFGVCGGIQDNGSACGPSNSLSYQGITGSDWWSPIGGDGQYVVPAPSDPNIIYAASQKAHMARVNATTRIAEFTRPYFPGSNTMLESKQKYRFNWTSPIAVSPLKPNTVYLGSDVVFRSTNGGKSWESISPDLTRDIKSHQVPAGGPVNHDISGAENTGTILSISVAPTDPRVIWVGTDDGLVWVTQDGGKYWRKFVPPVPSSAKLGRIYQIGVSPFSAGTAYFTVDAHMMGNPHPYVFKVTGYGRHSRRLNRDLPADQPAFVVREDPNRRGLLALGTDVGVYLSFDDGRNWTRLRANLPTMPVWDLQFARKPHDLVLATHGHGLWVLDNLELFENWSSKIEKGSFHLFPASKGIEWIKNRGHAGFVNPITYVAPNPPSGPVLAWWLKKTGKETGKNHRPRVKITVLDQDNQVVAVMKVPERAGVSRFSWDMRYAGPVIPKGMTPRRAHVEPVGPYVLPGVYHVKVETPSGQERESVVVASDPRAHFSQKIQRAHVALALSLRNEVTALSAMVKQTRSILTVLGPIAMDPSDTLSSPAKALRRKLQKFQSSLIHPTLQYGVPEDDLHYVARLWGGLMKLYYSVAGRVLVLPHRSVSARAKYLGTMLTGRLNEFNGVIFQAVEHYNRLAYSHGAETLAIRKVFVKKVAMHS